jgi:hypothetical protein
VQNPRRTVDFQALNKHAVRETHHMEKKTIFDSWNEYHSVPICEEDRHLTIFITPWGRHKNRTAPQGYIASGDGYTRHYIPNKTKCVDDALLLSNSIKESFYQAAQWLDICGHIGIILNQQNSLDLIFPQCMSGHVEGT